MNKAGKSGRWKRKRGGAQQQVLKKLLLCGGSCSYSSACELVKESMKRENPETLYPDAFLARLVDCGYVSLVAKEDGPSVVRLSQAGVKKVLLVWPKLIRLNRLPLVVSLHGGS